MLVVNTLNLWKIYSAMLFVILVAHDIEPTFLAGLSSKSIYLNLEEF